MESATDRIEHELGEIDVWVNVAFVGSLAFFWDTTPDEYRTNTVLTDLPEFAKSFRCKKTAAMVKPKPCRVW